MGGPYKSVLCMHWEPHTPTVFQPTLLDHTFKRTLSQPTWIVNEQKSIGAGLHVDNMGSEIAWILVKTTLKNDTHVSMDSKKKSRREVEKGEQKNHITIGTYLQSIGIPPEKILSLT